MSPAGARGCRPGSSAAAASSSAKNALPSDRRAIESTRAAPAARRRSRSAARPVRRRSNRPRSIRSTRGWRSVSASHAVNGWRRCSSSVRNVATMSSRSVRALRVRKASRSRVDRSAQWRSSMTSRTGVVSPSLPRSRSAPSKIRVWSHSRLARRGDPSPSTVDTSGTSRASSGRLGPAASAIRSGSTWRASDRRASTIGPNGSAVLAERDGATLEDQPVVDRAGARRPPRPGGSCRRRLAADEDERRLARGSRIGRREEFLQLPRAADEDRAGQAPSHGFHHRARYRPGRRPSAPEEGRRRSRVKRSRHQ